METNVLPRYDTSLNTTGCCPKFNPEGWDRQTLHFRDKPFLRAESRSIAHVPVDMGRVFSRVLEAIYDAGASDPDAMLVLSRDLSPWKSEHLFAVTKPVPGEAMTTLSGDFITKVFEGPYRNVRDWHGDMEKAVREAGSTPGDIYFFYTTCPKCAKAYGQNYVVGVARI